MTAATAGAQTFSPRTILALVIVGVVSFSGLAVLATFAPELRGAADGGAHALSASAIGFRGATVMLTSEGAPVVVSRTPPRGHPRGGDALTVITPPEVADLKPFLRHANLLIVLPKWAVIPMPLHPGFVQKYGNAVNSAYATALLAPFARTTEIQFRPRGFTRPALRGTGELFTPDTYLPLGPIDAFQTLSGPEWEPMLVDEQGHAVLARSRKHPGVVVLAEPDLLNNQGLASLDNARAGMAILNALRGEAGVSFDVTLNGFTRGEGVGRLMLEPPWLAATLCGVAAALLMGLHALARFGPALTRGRAIALGKSALVDNSAGLVRMARREAELAPAYAVLTKALVTRVAGGGRGHAGAGRDNDAWLSDLARRSGAADPAVLVAEAERAQTRDDLLAVGRNLYHWRGEITRERR
jgi:phage tail protein X